MVGIVRVTMLGPSEATVGAGDGQPSPVGAQVAGTGPIVVDVALTWPSRGTVAVARSSWIVAPGAAWFRPPQASLNVTGRVTTWPGEASGRTTSVWLPERIASPSA